MTKQNLQPILYSFPTQSLKPYMKGVSRMLACSLFSIPHPLTVCYPLKRTKQNINIVNHKWKQRQGRCKPTTAYNKHIKQNGMNTKKQISHIRKQNKAKAKQNKQYAIVFENVGLQPVLYSFPHQLLSSLYSFPHHSLQPLKTKQTKQKHNKPIQRARK